MKKLLQCFKKAKKPVNQQVIDRAYQNRQKEIDSLRQYDRGEKTITPSNLRKLVSNL